MQILKQFLKNFCTKWVDFNPRGHPWLKITVARITITTNTAATNMMEMRSPTQNILIVKLDQKNFQFRIQIHTKIHMTPFLGPTGLLALNDFFKWRASYIILEEI